MSRKGKALASFLLLVAIAVPVYFLLLVDSTMPSAGRFDLNIETLRKLANGIPGEKPAEIRFEKLSSISIPSTLVVAGSGWGETTLTVYAFQLIGPHGTAVIDTGADRRSLEKLGFEDFDEVAFARVGKALAVADPIVVTHEHADHIGGIAAQPNLLSLMPHLKLTSEQLLVPKKMEPTVFPGDALKGYAPLEYDKTTAIAPGVVLVKAAGHTPGSQMVFVQRADGTEYLFLGDVAWQWANVQQQRSRPRLVSMLVGEDRDAVCLQIQAIRQLVREVPTLQVVPGHDAKVIAQLVSAGVVSAGFAP